MNPTNQEGAEEAKLLFIQKEKNHFQVVPSCSALTNTEINGSLFGGIERVSGNCLGTLTLLLKGAQYHFLCMFTTWLGCCIFLTEFNECHMLKLSFSV